MKYVYDTPEKFYDALKDNIDDEFPIESFEKIEKDVPLANEKKWDINGEKVTIGVQKI